MAFKLVVEAFAHGDNIPKRHTCEGPDVAPSLRWEGEPQNSQSFALIMDDPDAPAGVWNHWLLFDIPPSVHALPEGHKAGQDSVSGLNDFGKLGYGGPCPPKGHGPHRYFFKLFALDTATLNLARGAKRADIDRAMRTHILGEAHYTGRYERK